MIERILSNLGRQHGAVRLLEVLLSEEFSHLSERNPGAVASVEFSIQELLRQLAVERRSLQAHYAALARPGTGLLAPSHEPAEGSGQISDATATAQAAQPMAAPKERLAAPMLKNTHVAAK